jgi:hypothetical protein
MRLALAMTLVLALLTSYSTDAVAISPSCLPGGFPATPGPGVVSKNVTWGLGNSPDQYRIDVWHVACQDSLGVALLLRAHTHHIGPIRLL